MKFRYQFLLISIFTLLLSYGLHDTFYKTRENKNWIGPYLSGAANLVIFEEFKIDEAEVINFKKLSPEEQYQYQFKRSDNLSPYLHNPIGYCYIIRCSTIMFPFLGETNGLILFQVLMHLVLCGLLLHNFRKNNRFVIFFSIFYVCNPLIIYFVVLNYYYFWQCLPGFILIYIIISKPKPQWMAILFSIILLFSTLARPTILFISVFAIILLYRNYSKVFAFTTLLICSILFLLINKPTEKIIWHTVYVGIGAYPNNYVPYISDNLAYQIYEDSTGDELNASLGGNYYTDTVIQKYTEITKSTVLSIFRKDPLLFIKNGISNTLQCFSLGYTGATSVLLNIFSAFMGLVYFILLWKTKQKFIIAAILLYALMFFPYYPPIPAYLFGAYILLVFSFYNVVSYYKGKIAPPLEIQYPF